MSQNWFIEALSEANSMHFEFPPRFWSTFSKYVNKIMNLPHNLPLFGDQQSLCHTSSLCVQWSGLSVPLNSDIKNISKKISWFEWRKMCSKRSPPFIAWAETKYKPSGDHDNRKTCVVPPQSSNGSLITCSQPQSFVRQTRTVRSSLCEAKNAPTFKKKKKLILF